MKTLLLAGAALTALAATPALAQDSVGSFGVTYTDTRLEIETYKADGQSEAITANFAVPVTAAWTVTLDSAYARNEASVLTRDDSSISGRVHASYLVGDLRVGGFVGAQEINSDGLWNVGVEAQKYMGPMTLTGTVVHENIEGTSGEIWSTGADVAYFVSPTIRVNAGLGYTSADTDGQAFEGWAARVGGEYQFAGTGFSLVADYDRTEFNDLNLSVDTVTVGARFAFGGNLQARERSGADLGRTAVGFGRVIASAVQMTTPL
jgi:hypothetical protein